MTLVDKSTRQDRMSHLVKALIDKTGEGKVSWEPTVSDEKFLAGFSKYVVSVEVGFEDGFRQERPYRTLSLLNNNGKTVDAKVEYDIDSSDYEELGELFMLARRSAYNAEESLDNLLQELQRI